LGPGTKEEEKTGSGKVHAQILGNFREISCQNPKKTPIGKLIFELFLYLCRQINRMPI
jgi:hypothetical protein